MAKSTLSLRVPESTIKQLGELKTVFNASASEVVEYAVNYFYENKEAAAQSVAAQIVARAKGDK
jgi:hypothetical protein